MRQLPRIFQATVGAAIVATVIATGLRAAQPFDHGIWLIAYLLLVGSLAQFLLARGQSALAPHASPRLIGAEALLWSLGVLTVPLGVLAGTRLLVAVGSIALLAALVLFWRETRPANAERGRELSLPYLALVAFMTLSVFVGMGLASNVPWA